MRWGAVFGILVAACAGTAAARETPSTEAPATEPPAGSAAPVNPILAYMDRDGDGKVTLNDYLNVQLPKMAKFDADGDGMLSYPEFRESLEPRARQDAELSFKSFDAEGARNRLTQREFLGYHAFIFNKFLDADHDGVLSAKEFARVMAQRR